MEPGPNSPSGPALGVPDSARWAAHLRALCAPVIGDVPLSDDGRARRSYIEGFRDEYGNRRATDRPFLAHVLGIRLDIPRREMALDERLWWEIQGGSFNAALVDGWIEPHGGLVVGGDALAIEYRTMVELCALHALWLIALRADSGHLRHRCLEAARWHTHELQPDNAINRPWGVAVFIGLALSEDEGDETRHLAHLHAQTLVHNASVNMGRPDLLSALILMDSAEQLGDPLNDPSEG